MRKSLYFLKFLDLSWDKKYVLETEYELKKKILLFFHGFFSPLQKI